MRGTIRLSVLRYWQRGRRSVAWALGKILVLTQCLPIQKGDPRPWYNGELYTQHRRGTRTNPPAVTSVWASWMSGVPFTHRQNTYTHQTPHLHMCPRLPVCVYFMTHMRSGSSSTCGLRSFGSLSTKPQGTHSQGAATKVLRAIDEHMPSLPPAKPRVFIGACPSLHSLSGFEGL